MALKHPLVLNGTTIEELQAGDNLTLSSPVIDGTLVEDVHTMSGTAVNPANGSIQILALTANTTLTESLTSGQSVVLGIDDGAAYTLTWPAITWVTTPAVAPTLATSGYTWVVLWKVGATLYGKY